MAYNAHIELNGNLGADPKLIDKDGKSFIALRIATTDSYPVKEGETTTWKDSNTTLWHDVLIFRPAAIDKAKTLKKGDRIEVRGSISYRSIKGADGYNHQEATIIGRWVEKVEFGKLEEATEEQLKEASQGLSQAA